MLLSLQPIFFVAAYDGARQSADIHQDPDPIPDTLNNIKTNSITKIRTPTVVGPPAPINDFNTFHPHIKNEFNTLNPNQHK